MVYDGLRKFKSTKVPSMFKISLESSLEGTPFLTKTIIAPPNLFQSLRKGGVKPGTSNCPPEIDSSNLVSDMTKMSTFSLI